MSEEHKPLVDSPDEDGTVSSPMAKKRHSWKSIVLIAVLLVVVVVALLAVGFAIGTFVESRIHGSEGSSGETYNWGTDVKINGKEVAVLKWLDDNLSSKNMENNLKNLTELPHIAGSEENKILATNIYNTWKTYKFDEVQLMNYTVYLSYPNHSNTNVLWLLDSSGSVIYNASTALEPPLTPGENDSTVAPPFNAYSGVGNASGPLVYVNYGRIEDFLYLTSNLSLNLTGYICIMRYGNIFRGNKALLAQQFGCVAAIIYSDPEQYAPRGDKVYPDGPYLPPGGVQRGSLLLPPGDPVTPGIPAIDGVYRRDYQEAEDEMIVTSIPTQPISYGDAIHFMSQLSEHEAPAEWMGQLNLTTYYIIQDPNNTNSTYIEINNYQEERVIHDVVATIYGSVEPDRYVVMGNHRDAWVFGAVDPNSGTAALLEIARGLGVLRKNNWRPGRTIVLCSWDAEEMGLIGSTEWVEDRGKLLGASTVAYLNVDVGVSGNKTFNAQATPLMHKVLYNASKLVKSPNPGFSTVYDEWLYYQNHSYNGTVYPFVSNLGSGSDFTAFLQSYGISCSSMTYSNLTGFGYSVYHSVHDNFFWMSHFGDPSFTHHLAIGLVWTKVAILIATTPVLPYDPRDYGIAIETIYGNLEEEYSEVLMNQNITLTYLKTAVEEFTRSSVALWAELQSAIANNPDENTVRILNNKLMNVERAFIQPEGLPGRPYYKHVVFAPSSVNSYGSSLFPGISDSIFNVTHQFGGNWNEVRRQIDIVRIHLRYASQIMDQPSLMYLQ